MLYCHGHCHGNDRVVYIRATRARRRLPFRTCQFISNVEKRRFLEVESIAISIGFNNHMNLLEINFITYKSLLIYSYFKCIHSVFKPKLTTKQNLRLNNVLQSEYKTF